MKRLFHIPFIFLVSVLALGLLPSCHSSKKAKEGFYQSQIDRLGGGKKGSLPFDRTASPQRRKIAEEAYTWLGTPYAYAHAEKGVATDCSGMVLMVYEKVTGLKLPRNSAKQAEFCKPIKKKNLQIGDLVFFATGKDPDKISHVGIMVDDSNFIHASASKGVVVSDITQPYYVRTLRAFGTVLDDN